jgi:hypothetical protein
MRIDTDYDFDPDVAAIEEALDPPRIPDREICPPRYDARGRLLPVFRVWMRDGYTMLCRARTAGEAHQRAIDDARAVLKRIGWWSTMTPHQRRLATTVDCWRQVD